MTIKDKNILIKLNTNPNIPSKDKNFDCDINKLQKWSTGYGYKYQKDLFEVGKQIKRISFSDFIFELKKCIETLPPSLLKKATILVSEHKSNKWVAEIANNYFPEYFNSNKNFLSLGHEDANEFILSLNKIPVQNWPNNLVLFDDGGFSGKQMARHVKAISEKIGANSKTQTNIFVIIPFMTNVAKQALNNLNLSKKIKLNLCNNKIIPTVKESLSEKSLNSLNELYGDILNENADLDSGIAITYFDHKVPNSQSFLFSLIAREIMPSIKPPYITNMTKNIQLRTKQG